jgi:hypothetical protein
MTNELIIQETALEFHENDTLNAIIDLHRSELKPYSITGELIHPPK